MGILSMKVVTSKEGINMKSYEELADFRISRENNRIKEELEKRIHSGFSSSAARRLAFMRIVMPRK